jgi:hypothetical protein
MPSGKDSEDWFTCPHCGAEVPAGARSCPECGADETTGWAEDAHKWAAGIPTGYSEDDEFDYDEFIEREFGGQKARPGGLPWRLLILMGLVFLLVWLMVLSC